MTYTERAARALDDAEKANGETEGYQWSVVYFSAKAIVFAILAVAVAIEAGLPAERRS